MRRAGGVLATVLALGAGPAARSAEAPITIDYVTGGIMSVHSETRIDLDSGTVSYGAAPLGPDQRIMHRDQRRLTVAEVTNLRGIVGALEPGEIDRDTCPLPRDRRTGIRPPKPPIADAMRSLVVTVAGKAVGGDLPVNACPTARVTRLLGVVSGLTSSVAPS